MAVKSFLMKSGYGCERYPVLRESQAFCFSSKIDISTLTRRINSSNTYHKYNVIQRNAVSSNVPRNVDVHLFLYEPPRNAYLYLTFRYNRCPQPFFSFIL